MSDRVTCDVGYPYANFSLPRPLCSRLRSDVRDRQTSDRRQTASSLNAPPTRGRGHNYGIFLKRHTPCTEVLKRGFCGNTNTIPSFSLSTCRQAKCILGVKWYNAIVNISVSVRTKLPDLSSLIADRRHTIFRHIHRLSRTCSTCSTAVG